ncbi:hypothetical protein A7A08_01730 [Methyloligella halotolerans]|uniref:Uncharacterized protein n=1 Tax=Methyloligella halotolerans TaxID=1177755 RepID=A0A1E2S042_9HYPH|nr:hypothetical protein [Methyloligella halotolerans]ODA67695.1 hypothetical protein A7A08_01730 [Methyloligella halotolerans]
MMSVYVIAGCLAWGGPNECIRPDLRACETRAEEVRRERKLPAAPVCELKWLGVRF